ncbi:MAG TPA: 1-deoxy-D-xylulose-5-phosphate synthase [Acidimicrobiales bacterium]|nr:1-deoxy-D-xylulose-5-phosphate synthase [Acidimicrobiales bacterium]
MILERIASPADLRSLGPEDLELLAAELRALIVDTVTVTGGHLGSNLGAVELTLAVHRAFSSPRDIVLWDTGHQAYVHKLITGRRDGFATLRQAGGLSGYPNRAESEHDWVENSHASTILSYAHGLATALRLGAGPERGAHTGHGPRRVVAVVGDGALTGGMAYEALNNLGHSGVPVVILLNDNGRSYAPTVSKLSENLTRLRLSPSYLHAKERMGKALKEIPAIGSLAMSGWSGLRAAVREVIEPHVFFEALGIRYAGPIDGHDIAGVERALAMAAEHDGPIVVHALTQKGRGYGPAEDDEIQCMHDFKVPAPTVAGNPPVSYTDAFSAALVEAGESDKRIVAITAAMPGPTGLLPFQGRFPDRFLDVGIAEQHAVTAAAGMAMGGLKPVVAIYSTFFTRAFDQANLDVGLHGLPVVFALDRAGITGDDGPSHHGVLDLALTLSVPGMTVFAPSNSRELQVMLDEALKLDGPSAIRWPKGNSPVVGPDEVGAGLSARRVREGPDLCLIAVGRMLEPVMEAADALGAEGLRATVWDARVLAPLDPEMINDAARHPMIVTVEDGIGVGGAGSHIAQAVAGVDEHRQAPPVLVLGVPSRYLPHGKPAAILSALGLDGPGIARSVRQVLEGAPAPMV